MQRIKITTDSNSGIKQSEGDAIGVSIVPMPFFINGEEYYEDINLSADKFFELLKDENAEIHTSLPSREHLVALWDKLIAEGYDRIIYIPMSSGLSSTCESARSLAEEYGGKVLVVDNTRISVPQKESVYEALKMVELGKTAEEIKEYLESTAKNSIIYIMVDTLKYLKKGGRVTAATAALGTMLRLKPLLWSDGGSFDRYAMPLSVVQAKRKMIETLKKKIAGQFANEYADGTLTISVAHTRNFAAAEKFKEEIRAAIPDVRFRFADELSLSVSCHIGPGALACGLIVNNYLD